MGMEYAGSGKNTGVGFLTEFWKKTYLDEYIREGGSKIKFVTGRTGAGKTFLTRTVVSDAKELGYMTAVLSAKSVWLYDFKEIYLEILRQCDIEALLAKCAEKAANKMG